MAPPKLTLFAARLLQDYGRASLSVCCGRAQHGAAVLFTVLISAVSSQEYTLLIFSAGILWVAMRPEWRIIPSGKSARSIQQFIPGRVLVQELVILRFRWNALCVGAVRER